VTSEDGGPPRGRLARTARLAALPAAYAGRTALGIGKRLGGRPAEVVAAQVQQRTAEQLFAVLGQLKGGAMKVGQAMSAMEAALPGYDSHQRPGTRR
jgi:predicted unusual protein kinase regulating ubiquinone biosynthesis (AarF/ABC1/UbiB family)